MREKLMKEIANYIPVNEQEAADKAVLLQMLRTQEDIFERTNLIAHMTASAWVVNSEHTKVLMVYHNIYHSWSWLGGHADGEMDLLAVAIREVQEESGIRDVKPVTAEIFSLETLTVDGHEKRGKYVPSHLHLNVTYLLEADDTVQTQIKADENSGVAWFGLEESIGKSSERWFRERVYPKLNEKLRSSC
ncbi:MAG: NUDIX hydrolase [Lachnospiraceae bacterium]|nr:NUDIX hydrolase [Lachnospiraceae bacterium]